MILTSEVAMCFNPPNFRFLPNMSMECRRGMPTIHEGFGMIDTNRQPTHSEAFRYVTITSDIERIGLNCEVLESVEAL